MDKNVKKIAFMGLMLALAVVFSFLESSVSAVLLLPPGIKLGLANIVTMYCLFFLGVKSALTLTVLKSVFIMIGRGGPSAAFLSLCGGMLSILVMILVLGLAPKASKILISIIGALSHNLGQLLAINIIMSTPYGLYYFPILAVSGIVMGSITGMLLRLMMPYLKNVDTAFK